MAQRVTLAQTQLQLAQSNPQMHNLHAAYRRMYQALEVQNIEEILPPPQEPQPMDPAMENAKALMGDILRAFPEQNHEAHIDIHIMFMKTPIVATSPQIMGSFMSHLQEHVSMLAKKQAMDEVKQALSGAKMMAEVGAVSSDSVAQYEQQLQVDMQNQQEVENLVVLYQQKIMADVLARLMPENPNEPDPLVAIRMQELELRRQKQEQEAVNDAAKLELETNKVEQRDRLDNARMSLQEEIADDRNEVNRERIAVNAEIQQMAMQRRG